jgi:hypothetical protein
MRLDEQRRVGYRHLGKGILSARTGAVRVVQGDERFV